MDGRRAPAGRGLLGAWAAACALALVGAASPAAASPAGGGAQLVVGYSTLGALQSAVEAARVRIGGTIGALHIADVRLTAPSAKATSILRRQPGIVFVRRARVRTPAAEPALATGVVSTPTGAYEWAFGAMHADAVPAAALRAAASITIAVVDSGADLTAPDIAAKAPRTANVLDGSTHVDDLSGHGTFVASIAAGSVTNADGIAGFGGDARLLVVKAGEGDTFTDFDVANGIVYAVTHGAKIVNVSVAGRSPSVAERRAVQYAQRHGALLVVAAGNDYADGNPTEYPAAFVQRDPRTRPAGLVVAASTETGARAPFSSTGSYVSVAAPGENLFGDVARTSSPQVFPRVALPGSVQGLYGFASGTSFAAPEVAGTAALVWAANPTLRASDVARIIEQSASGGGRWTPALGYGVVDSAAAVESALALR